VSAYPITAYTLCNGLGDGRAPVLQALAGGRSGLGPGPFELPMPTSCGRVRLELEPVPEAWAVWDTRQARLASHVVAGLRSELQGALRRWGPDRIGLLLGSSTGGIRAAEEAFAHQEHHGVLPADFDLERQHAMHAALDVLRFQTGIRGPSYTVSTACSSSGRIFASAKRLLDVGLVDAVLLAGVDTLCEMTLRGFHSLQLLSSEPCRPFSAERRGINLGEGGAALLLEREGRPRARLLGVGESNDAHHMTSPHPEGAGALLAMRRALHMAGLSPDDVSHVNAHATGTPLNDAAESRAITSLLGPGAAVVATKGYTGHLLGAAGATEAVFAILAMEEGWLPASLGAEPVDPEIEVEVRAARWELESRVVLSNSLAFGGSNVAVLLGAP
jgi:3-oxoacyl-[acyl-carrier-protein] synthase-1